MEIREIYFVCKESYEKLNKIKVTKSPSGLSEIKDSNTLIEVLNQLGKTKYLDVSLKKFQNELFLFNKQLIPSQYDVTKFENAKTELLTILHYIMKTYEITNPEVFHEEIPGLDIHLPLHGNFTDFKKDVDNLEFILTKCPFFQSNEEHLELKSVHNGSVLFTFIVISAGTAIGSTILNNIAAFIDKCFVLRSHYLTIKQQSQDVENSNREQQAKDKILESLTALYKIQVDYVIKELEDSLNYKIEDGDEKGRIEQSFEKFNKLIDQGMQIYTTIGTPEETKLLFEPLKMKYLSMEESIKTIDKIKKESDENNSDKE